MVEDDKDTLDTRWERSGNEDGNENENEDGGI